MNCKPGDLAIVVRAISIPSMLGLVVEVERLAPYGFVLDESNQQNPWRDVIVWVVKVPRQGRVLYVDSSLCPIRPGDLEDETPTVRELEAV